MPGAVTFQNTDAMTKVCCIDGLDIIIHEYVWDDEKATIINNKIKFIQIFDFPLNWWIVLNGKKKKKSKIENRKSVKIDC